MQIISFYWLVWGAKMKIIPFPVRPSSSKGFTTRIHVFMKISGKIEVETRELRAKKNFFQLTGAAILAIILFGKVNSFMTDAFLCLLFINSNKNLPSFHWKVIWITKIDYANQISLHSKIRLISCMSYQKFKNRINIKAPIF